MSICSGLLIGWSAPPPMSTHSVREHDSAHGEMTSWGRQNLTNEGLWGKSNLTSDIASRYKRRQLRPRLKTPNYFLTGRGDDSQLPDTMQGRQLLINCCRAGSDGPSIGGATVLPTEARRSNQPRPLTSPQGASLTTPIKGRLLPITCRRAGGRDSQSTDAMYAQTTRSGMFLTTMVMHSVVIITRIL